MNDLHRAYLNLGSNIEPELNLSKAVQLLRERGQVSAVSRAWESESVGFDAPHYLNACVLFLTSLEAVELKEQIIHPIESALGRVRETNQYAPRIIDIDILIFDKTPFNTKDWNYAFAVVPLAELSPDFIHPIKQKKLSLISVQMQDETRIVPRNVNWAGK